MNINKFTQKSMEAVNGCEKLAYRYNNQEVDQEHFLLSLLTIDDSLIKKLLEKMDVPTGNFGQDLVNLIEQRPKVSGDVQVYMSNALNKVLINAEDEAKAMGDE